MYKDKAKQKQANRERQRRYKLKPKALLNKGVTGKALPGVTAEDWAKVGEDFRQVGEDILKAEKKFRMTVMERLFYRPASELGSGEHNFVSLPGRACYGVY